MPLEFPCASCRKMLRVPETAAGKKARCPECGHISNVPSQFVPQQPPPATPPSDENVWTTGNWTSAPADEPFRTPAQSQSDNPFQSPSVSVAQYSSPVMLQKVQGPAIGLIVVGCLTIPLALIGLVSNLFFGMAPMFGPAGRGGPGQLPPGFAFLFMGAVGIIPGLLSLVRGGLMIYGGMQMRKLQTYPWCMTAGILAVVPCLSNCCLIDLPIGIWALVVLGDASVKQAFQQNSLH